MEAPNPNELQLRNIELQDENTALREMIASLKELIRTFSGELDNVIIDYAVAEGKLDLINECDGQCQNCGLKDAVISNLERKIATLAKQCKNKERNRVFQPQQNKNCGHCHNDNPPSIEPTSIRTSHQMPQVAADRGINVKDKEILCSSTLTNQFYGDDQLVEVPPSSSEPTCTQEWRHSSDRSKVMEMNSHEICQESFVTEHITNVPKQPVQQQHLVQVTKQLPAASSCDDHLSGREHLDEMAQQNMEEVTDVKNTYKQQSQNDEGHHCDKVEEETTDSAQVQPLAEIDWPHPPISIASPTENELVHTEDATVVDGGEHTVYCQNHDWVKGIQIGSGAFCSCFLARDNQTGTLMAVKQVNFTEAGQKQLMKEVSLMKELQHPNIVRCLRATKEFGYFNIFLEWMAGGSLEELRRNFGPFHPLIIEGYTKQIVCGLAFIHSHGIIHRDLKGANILVDSTGQRLRIADFGTAARLAAQITKDDEFSNQLKGTVPYMAPEVVRGEHYGRSCDVWSLGCCIFLMATGKLPWNSDDLTNECAFIFEIGSLEESPVMPDGLTVEVRELGNLCLKINPQDRPKSRDLLKHSIFDS